MNSNEKNKGVLSPLAAIWSGSIGIAATMCFIAYYVNSDVVTDEAMQIVWGVSFFYRCWAGVSVISMIEKYKVKRFWGVELVSFVFPSFILIIYGFISDSVSKSKPQSMQPNKLKQYGPTIFLLTLIFVHILLKLNKTYDGMTREQYGSPNEDTTILYFNLFPLWTINLIYLGYFVYALIIATSIIKMINHPSFKAGNNEGNQQQETAG